MYFYEFIALCQLLPKNLLSFRWRIQFWVPILSAILVCGSLLSWSIFCGWIRCAFTSQNINNGKLHLYEFKTPTQHVECNSIIFSCVLKSLPLNSRGYVYTIWTKLWRSNEQRSRSIKVSAVLESFTELINKCVIILIHINILLIGGSLSKQWIYDYVHCNKNRIWLFLELPKLDLTIILWKIWCLLLKFLEQTASGKCILFIDGQSPL